MATMKTSKNTKSQQAKSKLLNRVGYTRIKKEIGEVRHEWPEEYSSSPSPSLNNDTILSETIANNCTKRDNRDFVKISRENYVSAPAYNKGAYQVVSKEEIKHIGRK